MIGVVLVTHGGLAAEFRSALEHVVGPQRQIEAVTIGPEDDIEHCRNDIIEAVKKVDSGEGVAILTDMFESGAELNGEPPVGDENKANHQELLAGDSTLPPRERAPFMTIPRSSARGFPGASDAFVRRNK